MTDVIMPEMNGKVCFDNLKELNPNVKVIIASGMGEIEKKKELETLLRLLKADSY